MDIVKATRRFEKWVRACVPSVVMADLVKKYQDMASNEFLFFRATFYFWILKWFKKQAKKFAWATVVLSIGDIHVDNFGSWRDFLARLLWGLNDRDEVYPLPWPQDLIRLSTSAIAASRNGNLALSPGAICDAVFTGYVDGIKNGPCPFVLEERHPKLRAMMVARLKDPGAFWRKLQSQVTAAGKVPASAKAVIEDSLPLADLKVTIGHRQAGEGSLGLMRFVAIGEFQGGLVAREVKSLRPSACVFALAGKISKPLYGKALKAQYHDPFVEVAEGWIARRLAPDCSRIELSSLPEERDERLLLEAMGFEIANFHLLTEGAGIAILSEIEKHGSAWLLPSCQEMSEVVHQGYKDWRRHWHNQTEQEA